MRKELRKIITLKLLDWAMDICPEGEFRRQFVLFLNDNIMKL